jgi:hypothetical protein
MIDIIPSARVDYYQGIHLVLWIIVIILFFIGSILFLIGALKAELKSTKMGYLSHCVYCSFYGIARIFFMIAFFNPENYDFIMSIGYVFATLSIIFWVFFLETYIVEFTKKIFSIITVVILALSVFSMLSLLNRYDAVFLINILTPFSVGLIFFVYLYITIKAKATVRKKVFLLFIGVFLIYLGHFMDTEFFLNTFKTIPIEISPILMLIGLSIFVLQFYNFPYFYIKRETI